MSSRKANPEKASKLEAKGDRLLEKGKVEKALRKFKKAHELDPSRRELYDKMISARDKLPGDWEMEDFVESVSLVMEKQEEENPPIRQVHAKLSPEWDDARMLVLTIVGAADENEAEAAIQKLVAMGEVGTRAAIEILLKLKEAPEAEGAEDKEEEIDEPKE